jgi:hypothetical protein
MLVKQTQWLVESLGHKTYISFHENIKYHLLMFNSKLKLMSDQQPKPLKWSHDRRLIRKITEIPAQPCVHFETSSTMLVGEGFISCR